MKKGKWAVLMAALALTLVVTSSVSSSLAYFTTYVTAKGGVTIEYGSLSTELDEQVEGWEKTVNVKNTGTLDAWVRVRAYAGSQFDLRYAAESGWRDGGDGWWYYSEPLAAGEVTAVPVVVTISGPEELPEEFNVVVVQECTPVSYREDGTAYADWNLSVREEAAQ